MPPRASPSGPPHAQSPVLLLGAGTGEATCGILYLAGFLRRNGVEAVVRLDDADESEEELARSLASLVAHVRPRLVGISLKWFHHLHRALLQARLLRELAPGVTIVLGGNTASYWWKELLAQPCVDHVVLGDGELPLLALCRGDAAPPNVASRAADGTPRGAPFSYVQGAGSEEVFYSHFDELFLSELDRSSFSGWVAPGKGCGENCVYCGGGRGVQKASFGRAKPFLRTVESVRRDHDELAPRVWQFRYDYAGGTTDFLHGVWAGLDLTAHSTTYFLWGAPPTALIETLARTFGRVFMVLDIGCFSELQRTELMRRGLLKPCPTDRQLLAAVEECRKHGNLQLELCGIAGLPFTSDRALEQERRLVERLLGLGCTIGYQRLEAQPGALVTEHPARFGMVSEARTFDEFLAWFEREDAPTEVPMVRFLDPAVEKAVARTCAHLQEAMQRQAARREVPVEPRTRLVSAVASTRQVELGAWLGLHRVPARVAHEPVTVVRARDGAGLACTPALSPRRFADPMLQQGEAGAAILAALAAFARPTTVDAAVAQLGKKGRLDQGEALELVDHLAAGRFLQQA